MRRGGLVFFLGIISGALFYGDAIITPALSVLSAIEGMKIVTPAFDAYVVPLTVLVLVSLFAVQSRGTASVAAFFGPIMLLWFVAIAAGGIWHVGQNLRVLLAFNPWYGVNFLLHHGIVGFYTLGAVFLVVTGAEALYADLGDKDQAFQWLNTAYQERASELVGLKTDFKLDPIRSDPRFAELVRKVGLPQ